MPDRHHRQRILPEIGGEGQRRLAQASAAIVGVGAIGSVSAEMLARAGVGTLLLIDRDIVEPSNLQRQMLYSERDIGRPKAHAAADRLRAIDKGLTLEPIAVHLDAELALDHLRRVDVIVDGTDNFETRYLLNDAAVALDRPAVFGGALGTAGTVLPIVPGRGPCLRCLQEQIPLVDGTCDTVGVLGPIVAMVGARQAALAIRLIVEGAASVTPTLESIDAWSGRGRSLGLEQARDPDCPCCGQRRFDFLDEVASTAVQSLCGRRSVQIRPQRRCIDLAAVSRRLGLAEQADLASGMLTATLRDEIGIEGSPIELRLFADGRAILTGLTDATRARSLYDRYIGG